jgi:cholesterol transport system auxiliary component
MKTISLLLSACLLAACVGSSGNRPQPTSYDFGLPVERVTEEGRWSKVAVEVKAPQWVDARDIGYRLLYENPLSLRSYAASHWAGAPGPLLSQRLRQQLGMAGGSGSTAAACLLRLELQEFSQVFDTPLRSRGLLQGRASMLDRRRQIIAEREFVSAQAAPTADARGGVMALVATSEDLGRQLAAWLNDLEKRGTLKGCRSAAEESQ